MKLVQDSGVVLEEIVEAGGEQVAIVSHAGVLRAFLGHFLSMNPKHFFQINIDYAGVSRVAVNGPYYTIQYINR